MECILTTLGHLTFGFEALIAKEMHFEDMGAVEKGVRRTAWSDRVKLLGV